MDWHRDDNENEGCDDGKGCSSDKKFGRHCLSPDKGTHRKPEALHGRDSASNTRPIVFGSLAIMVTCVTLDPLALRSRLSPGLPFRYEPGNVRNTTKMADR